MKRHLNLLFSLFIGAVLSGGCFAPSGDAETVELSSPGGYSLSQKGGSMFLSVSSNASWSLEIVFEGEDEGWAEVTPSSGTGDKSSIVLSWKTNNSDSERSFRVVASTKSVTPTEGVLFTQVGPSRPVNHDGTSTKAGWLELPETKDGDGLDFFVHDMPLGGQTVRNYSFYWDYDALVARWVAYPLNKGLYGSGTRSDAWALDPLIPEAGQPVLFKGFQESGTYARGHQLPSAHRLNYQANIQTFYGTNMTPQRHTFNEGIWATLEARVKDWSSSCDTLYCITGCDLKGSTEYAHDNYGSPVAIPTAYWKACLRYSSAGTVGFNGYSACAFYLKHDYSGSSLTSSMAISIDELEEILGIDLFVNLPAKVGAETAAKIESQNPSSVSLWW